MPQNGFGKTAFAAINDAVTGTAIDRSELFQGFGSLFEKYRPKVPESYRKWKAAQVKKVEVSQTKNVGHKEAPQKVENQTSRVVERSAIIDRQKGGFQI